MGIGIDIIRQVAEQKGLFRERDVRKAGVSPACLDDARVFRIAKPHGHGVWSHPNYIATRYELFQIRFPKAVFWGPSALWLQWESSEEPEDLWVAIGYASRYPRNIELGTVVVRTRSLEKDLVVLKDEGRAQSLRVHSIERAKADVAKNDSLGLISSALRRREFVIAPNSTFLWNRVEPSGSFRIPPAPRLPLSEHEQQEHWKVVRSL